MKTRRLVAPYITAAILVALGALWIAFAPLQFGGQAGYVIVNGISMEPGFHKGDLVILRQAESYQVGDVVTYRHPTIGPVIHRIIAFDLDRFVFKGDNNSWVDSYHPTGAELMGRLWIHLPGLGRWVEHLREPRAAAALAGLVGVVIMAPLIKPMKRRERRPAGVKSSAATPAVPGPLASEGVFFGLATLLLASLVLAIFAFTRPLTRTASETLRYTQSAQFHYSATAPAGIYDSTTIRTGEPIFLSLTPNMAISATYALRSPSPRSIAGRAALVAQVSDDTGWQRRIELQPPQPFTGDTVTVAGTLDLRLIAAMIGDLERETNIDRMQYTVKVLPEVELDGLLGGEQLQERFAPDLQLTLDDHQLQVTKLEELAASGFARSKDGVLPHQFEQPNHLSLLVLRPEVRTLRWVAALGLLLVGGLLGWLTLATLRVARRSQSAAIALKYGSLLIEGAHGPRDRRERIVHVATIDDLAKLALREGRLMVHTHAGEQDVYAVREADTVYVYQTTAAPAAADATYDEHPVEEA